MKFRTTTLLLAAITLAACGDDSTAPTGDRMTREEAVTIAAAMTSNAQATSNTASARPAQDAIASDPSTFTHDFDTSVTCPKGGTLALKWHATGTFDLMAGTMKMDVTGTQTPAACAYDHEGVTLTVDGDPKLGFEAHASMANQRPDAPLTVKVDGGFKWSASDGRSGTCSIAYSEVTDFAAKKRTVDGTVCGHTIKETLTWT